MTLIEAEELYFAWVVGYLRPEDLHPLAEALLLLKATYPERDQAEPERER